MTWSPRLLAAALMLPPAMAASQTLPPPEQRQLARAILEELVEINTVRDSGAHGKDERIGVQAFYEGIEFMYRLMKDLGGKVGKAGKDGKGLQ